MIRTANLTLSGFQTLTGLSQLTQDHDIEVDMKRQRDTSPDGRQPEGRYANYFQVGHNAFEFILDFGQCYHDNAEARIHTRIVTSPAYAKALLETLQASLEQYEQVFGGKP